MYKNRIIELLARKLAGEATQSELEELNDLITRYPDSVYYEEFLDQLWSNADEQADVPDVDQAYLQHKLKFAEEFSSVEEKHKTFSLKKYRNLIAIAAVLLVIVSVSLFYFSRGDKFSPDTQIVAGKGIRKKIKLPDGTMVWLNSDSKLSYESDINQKKRRIVYLVGEAFFDVAHRQSQPFIVRTDKICVKVLGTAFNIKAYPIDKKSEATLIRGSIELSVNDRSEQKILLSPSEKFALVEDKKVTHAKSNTLPDLPKDITLMIEHVVPVRIGDNEYIEETSWRDSQLVFRNESLDDLKPKLERWFNVQIKFDKEQPKSYRFTGVFKNETLEETLKAMQLIKPFNFKLKEHDLIIY
jgi:ferric-dicitrate binding protein FerR (iron transport regulator)